MVLLDRTKAMIERQTGLTYDEVREMDWEDIDRHIARKYNLPNIPIVSYDPLMRLSYTKDIDREIARI